MAFARIALNCSFALSLASAADASEGGVDWKGGPVGKDERLKGKGQFPLTFDTTRPSDFCDFPPQVGSFTNNDLIVDRYWEHSFPVNTVALSCMLRAYPARKRYRDNCAGRDHDWFGRLLQQCGENDQPYRHLSSSIFTVSARDGAGAKKTHRSEEIYEVAPAPCPARLDGFFLPCSIRPLSRSEERRVGKECR